ncbi:MAG TPA: aldo/keto reductase [Thermomicrobiales bacterium]|nr:aldo/keto reductase [Thermomicrobiales bacterium]
METRRLGRLGHMSSVIIYGGAALGAVSQDVADASIQLALENGINHFDTAASYGDSELRLGPWMPRIRNQIFLATKTTKRTRDEALREIERSLERLQVQSVDLLQLHSIGEIEQLDLATGPGGALEGAIAAQEQGLIGAIGITGHGHKAPAVHREALRRYPFATVLTPLNPVLYRDPGYRRDFDALVTEVRAQDAGLMTIKTVARRPWPQDAAHTHATWYEPLVDQAQIDAAVAFVLSHEAITGLATAGDVHLLPLIIQAEARRREVTPAVIEAALPVSAEYVSPFAEGGP